MKKRLFYLVFVAVIGSVFTLALFGISPKFVYADSSYSFTAHQADFESTDSTTNFQDMDDVPPTIDLSSGNPSLNFYGIWYIKDGEIREKNHHMATFINDNKVLKFTSIPKLTINEKNLFQILYTTDGTTFSETAPDSNELRGFEIMLKDWTGSYSSNTQPMLKYEYSMTTNREYIIEKNLLDINYSPFSGEEFSASTPNNFSHYHMNFHYTKEKAADVTIKYVDENGNEIHTAQTLSGNVGDSYDAAIDSYKLTIDGYDIDESNLPSNATGTLSAMPQTVTYHYKSSLKLNVPEAINFGQYKLGTANTVLSWDKASKVVVEGTGTVSQWDLSVTLASGSSIEGYIKIGDQVISDQPQNVIDGSGPMDVTSKLSSDKFVKIDYAGVKKIRKDTGSLEWTLSPSTKEVSE